MTDSLGSVLVTGADGALGRRLVRTLTERGARVASAGRRDTQAEPSAHRITADIMDFESMRRGLEDFAPDAVIHLAAMRGAACAESPGAAHETNVTATAALARASADAGVARFIFASSAAVYGDAYSRPIREADELSGDSVYARSKSDAEARLHEISRETGMEVVALRIFNIYGKAFESSLVTRLVESSPAAPVVIRGLDEFERDYIHVDDVARTCERAVSAPLQSPFLAVNVGSGEATSNARLLELVSAKRQPSFVVEPGSPSYSVADVTQMRAVLGFAGTPISTVLATTTL